MLKIKFKAKFFFNSHVTVTQKNDFKANKIQNITTKAKLLWIIEKLRTIIY